MPISRSSFRGASRSARCSPTRAPFWTPERRNIGAARFQLRKDSAVTSSEALNLFTLLGEYPTTAALKAGEISSDLVKFTFADIKVANTGFKPLVREHK